MLKMIRAMQNLNLKQFHLFHFNSKYLKQFIFANANEGTEINFRVFILLFMNLRMSYRYLTMRAEIYVSFNYVYGWRKLVE